jgi:RES domain
LEFGSWQSYTLFRQEVTQKARYVHSPETARFLEAVARGAESRALAMKKGQKFYRAQVAHKDEVIKEIDDTMPAPALPDRMMPRADRATEGRVNPKGIPCLYMASHEETAIAEVRPWIGSFVSVAIFAILREQRVVDCTNIGGRGFRSEAQRG